jgi:hypothetical protein
MRATNLTENSRNWLQPAVVIRSPVLAGRSLSPPPQPLPPLSNGQPGYSHPHANNKNPAANGNNGERIAQIKSIEK